MIKKFCFLILRVLICKVGVYRPKVYNANVLETDGKLTNQTYIYCVYIKSCAVPNLSRS